MEKYSLKNQIEKIKRNENSVFLNQLDANYVINTLKKENIRFNIFKPYEDAEKQIIYQDKLNITLFEIKCREKITHREILGALFSNNLNECVYGDIIIDNDKYYITILDKIKKDFLYNFNKICNNLITLEETNLEKVKDYKPSFKEITLQVSSLRIDNIIAKLIPTSRSISNEMINLKKVVLNYQILKNKNYILKENDIFSIRRVGKFKLKQILSKTKNNKYIIKIDKYS